MSPPEPDREDTNIVTRNRGQSLVAEFRAARLNQRPALQTELRSDRLALRQQRLTRLGRTGATDNAPDVAEAKSQDAPVAPQTRAPAEAKSNPAPIAPSWFAQLVDKAQDKAQDKAHDIQAKDIQAQDIQAQSVPAQPVQTVSVQAPDIQTPLSTEQPPQAGEEPASQQAAAPAPDHLPAPPPAPALSSIGFGPGMVLRFAQLGIETASDLAAADEAALRESLGDISRLVNVEVWIASAKRACAHAALRKPQPATICVPG
jgi:hypothetical protein